MPRREKHCWTPHTRRSRTRPWTAVRMVDVAAAAGVSRQTLYNEFGSKDGLARALVRRAADGYLAGVDRTLGRRPRPRGRPAWSSPAGRSGRPARTSWSWPCSRVLGRATCPEPGDAARRQAYGHGTARRPPSCSRCVRDRAVAALAGGTRRRATAAELALTLRDRAPARPSRTRLVPAGLRAPRRGQCAEPGQLQADHADDDQRDRHQLERGDHVVEEDHPVDRRTRRADARPHRVRRADVELLAGPASADRSCRGRSAQNAIVGQSRVNPCESFRHTAKPVSSSPATTTSSHAIVRCLPRR